MSTQVNTAKAPKNNVKTAKMQKVETPKTEAQKPKIEEQKPKIEKSESTVNSFLNPTAQDRINRMENFQIMAKKYAHLKNKQEELDRFLISSDGTQEKIYLENAEGYKFTVSNTQVIEKVVDTIAKELQVFLEKSNDEILNFTV